MLLRSNVFLINVIELLLIISLLTICFFKWKYSYWRKRKIPYLQPNFPFGNIRNPFFMKEKIGVTLSRFYTEFKRRGWKHGGFYFFVTPIYLVVDLEYIKNILTKDFDCFIDRGVYYNEKDDPLSAHLVNLGGDKWKTLRRKLNPTYTTMKIKTMYVTLQTCVDNLIEKIEAEYQENQSCNITEIFPSFLINVICSCSFGFDCNIFKEENSLFKIYANECVTWTTYKYLVQIFASCFPETARKFGVGTIPKTPSKFFTKLAEDNIKHREENSYIRNDFMQLLINLKNEKLLTVQEIIAQCFIFFLAGFETSSTALILALYEISKNEDIQERIRTEISDEITYESLTEMKYLDQVIEETLRMYPPFFYLTRQCVKDYKIPDKNVIIEKGTLVAVPILAIHYDEEYYPNPEKFDPERFNKVNKSLRHPYTFLPFGDGPRICIGKRFALLEIKMALAFLLKSYKFRLNKKTKEPIKMRIDSTVLAPKNEIWLDIKKL